MKLQLSQNAKFSWKKEDIKQMWQNVNTSSLWVWGA